jgi:uncharacterized membrane protein
MLLWLKHIQGKGWKFKNPKKIQAILYLRMAFYFVLFNLKSYNENMKKLSNFINKHSQKLLWLFILFYAIILSVVCIWKYNNFLYGGLDLAIINNVFYNTAHGNWFWSSIQGHSYLGDHFTPILVLLLPIYWLWQSPQTLLVLQSIFLGLAAWPIYKIAQLILKENKIALVIGVLWLINPLVHNINLFEFHFIALAPLFIFMAFYYYLKIKDSQKPNKKLLFYYFIFIFLSLLIREDIAFIIIIFGLITLIDNFKNKKFLITNYQLLITLVAAGYLLLANTLINKFSPSSLSPFFYYYAWLGNATFSQVIKHLITYTNFEMLVGFLLPFLFIPLFKPKWLLLSIVPLGQIVLSGAGGGASVWQLHYGALFLPALIISFIYAFDRTNKFINHKLQSKYLLLVILVVSNIYLWIDLGTLKNNFETTKKSPNLEMIEVNAPIMASFNYLANLSSRENIYALHYYFLGVQQFAQADYALAQEPEYILLDTCDYEYYDEILKTSAWAGIYYNRGYQRLEELFSLYEPLETREQVSLLKRI